MGKGNKLVSAKNSDDEFLKLCLQPPKMVSSSSRQKDNLQPPVLTAANCNIQNPKPPSTQIYDFFKSSSSSFQTNSNEQKKKEDGDDKKEDGGLDLSLSIKPPGTPPSTLSPPPPPSPPQPNYLTPVAGDQGVGLSYGIGRQSKTRKNPFQKPKRGKSESVDAVYPWATNRRAMVHTLPYLLSHGICEINGHIECKECQETFLLGFKLEEKFNEIREYVTANKSCLNNRAPKAWMNPRLYNCKTCGSELKPVIAKKREINWLFLLLGNMLGCCKLAELKYFCKHNKKHRTGAKNRLLFSTYIGLCKQLEPNNQSFDIDSD